MKTLVIGYGNPLRGDDGVGWLAAQELAEALASEGVEVLGCHQLTPELAEAVSQADLVLFLDAAEGPVPGRIASLPVDPESPSEGVFSHHVSPSTLLAVARQIYGRCPEGIVLTVAGASFECTPDLSTEVAAALPVLVERVKCLVRDRRTLPAVG